MIARSSTRIGLLLAACCCAEVASRSWCQDDWDEASDALDGALGSIPGVNILWGLTSAGVNAYCGNRLLAAADLSLALDLFSEPGAAAAERGRLKRAKKGRLKKAEAGKQRVEADGGNWAEEGEEGQCGGPGGEDHACDKNGGREDAGEESFVEAATVAGRKQGVYCYRNKETRLCDYIGLSNNLGRRTKEHKDREFANPETHNFEVLKEMPCTPNTAERRDCVDFETRSIAECKEKGACTFNKARRR